MLQASNLVKLLLILATIINTTKQEDGCPIDVIGLYPWDPLVTRTNSHEILYPPVTNEDKNYTMTVSVGETIIISCPKGRFLSVPSGLTSVARTIYATCNEDSQLESHEEKIINFANVSCVSHDPISVKITRERCGGPDTVIIEVGLQIGANINLAPQIRVCFDKVKKIPLFAQNNITKSIGFIKSYLVTQYLEDNLYNYGKSFDDIYNITNQQKVFNNLLGAEENSTDYLNPGSCRFGGTTVIPGFCLELSPLVYRGTFVYLIQQYSTYRYINTVPTWTFVFEYNWYKLEINTIDYIKQMKVDLEVYTGTWGTTTLKHAKTEAEVDLYLYVDEEKQEKSLPVPALLWKLLYDPISKAATVFVTVNNPYRVKEQEVICNDIQDSIGWLTWESRNVTKGFSYACAYDEAKDVISYLPDLYVLDILT